MTVDTIDSSAAAPGLASDLLALLEGSSRAWPRAVEWLRSVRWVPGSKPGICSVHEPIAAARPALLATLQRALGGTLLVVVPTPDAAERSFADLLYYLGEHSEVIALL